jgi:DNA topoisomerase-3
MIWKEIAGAKISMTDVKNLLEGKPAAARDFIYKAGKKFRAALVMNQGKLEFRFSNKRKRGGPKKRKQA